MFIVYNQSSKPLGKRQQTANLKGQDTKGQLTNVSGTSSLFIQQIFTEYLWHECLLLLGREKKLPSILLSN